MVDCFSGWLTVSSVVDCFQAMIDLVPDWLTVVVCFSDWLTVS